MMAPLSEEFVYRACMMPLVMQSLTATQSVFVAPLFFGVAHIHHIIERLNMGMAFNTALVVSRKQYLITDRQFFCNFMLSYLLQFLN